MNTDSQQGEYLLNEYSQAVDSYQKAVLELREASANNIPCDHLNLLAKADVAKHILDGCRDRYHQYCALQRVSDN